MRESLKTVVRNTPLYRYYRYYAHRRKIRRFWRFSTKDEERLAFYRQFIDAGDLVFDVGANLGNRAKVFSRLGAIVVAVEPQTVCTDFLVSVFRDKANFHLVRKALGASTGQAEILICDKAHVISSLSPEWVRSVKESGRFSEYNWNRRETVCIDTLDNLVAQYGRPTFIKIDVEGFEDKVVSRLSTPVRALSMEFTPEFMESTFRCIEHLSRIGDFRFQMSLGESMRFTLPGWVKAEEIRRALSAVPLTAFGDLYARFNS